MSAEPRILSYTKSLAKKIKKLKGIKHTAALDEAAQLAGFNNYRHLLNSLKEKQ